MRTPEQEFAVRCLGGHPTGLDASIFVIEADGECQSLNGSHILCDRWFPSLPDALDLLTTEFPDDEATPCPDDDMILIWEVRPDGFRKLAWRSEEHTSELQSLMRNSYAVFLLKK